MSFPSVIELIKQYNVFLLTGPLLLIVSACGWWRYICAARTRVAPSPSALWPDRRRQTLGTLLVMSLIGLVHFVGIYASLANAWRFRTARLDQVTAVRVEQIGGLGESARTRPFKLENPALVQAGLRTLTGARSRSHNHESFVNGYRLQLLFGPEEEGRDLYLSVFRGDRRGMRLDVVIPHVGPDGQGTVKHAGEYSCPQFQQWVRDNIDPLFPAQP